MLQTNVLGSILNNDGNNQMDCRESGRSKAELPHSQGDEVMFILIWILVLLLLLAIVVVMNYIGKMDLLRMEHRKQSYAQIDEHVAEKIQWEIERERLNKLLRDQKN